MKFKLIDVRGEAEENVQFGTCELCMSIGDLHKEVFYFLGEEDNLVIVEDGFWSWGSYMHHYYHLDELNILEIAEWFKGKDIQPDEYGDYEQGLIDELVNLDHAIDE